MTATEDDDEHLFHYHRLKLKVGSSCIKSTGRHNLSSTARNCPQLPQTVAGTVQLHPTGNIIEGN